MPEDKSPATKNLSVKLHKIYNRIRSKSQEPVRLGGRGVTSTPTGTIGAGDLFGERVPPIPLGSRTTAIDINESENHPEILTDNSNLTDVSIVVVPATGLEGRRDETSAPLTLQKEEPLPMNPSHRQTAKNALKATLVAFSNILDGVPLPGAKGVVEIVIKLITVFEATVNNLEALQELDARCLRLLDVVVKPLVDKDEFEISSEYKTIVQRFESRLLKLLAGIEAPQMGFITRMINHEDITSALKDVNDQLSQLVDFFMLETHVLGIFSQEKLAKTVKKHALHQLIQSLPRANAAYDSYLNTSQTRSVCFPNTRQQLLGEIMEWMTSTDSDNPSMYILDGIAGIGKSTVAQTIAERCAQLGYLGASFFFSSKENDRKTARLFFSTLAFDLACYSQEFAHAIHTALEQIPNAAEKALHQQLRHLLVEPLQGLCLKQPIVIIVDALDECDKTEAEIILSLLSSNVQELPGFKIFMTTRPEQHIRKMLQKFRDYDQFHLHEIEASVVQADIGSYLAYELSAPRIKMKLPESTWELNDEQLGSLVKDAGRLFIIASTAIRFILDERKRNPQSQVMKMLSAFRKETNLDVTKVLDGMYFEILQTGTLEGSDDDDINLFQKVIGTIIVLGNPLPLHSLAAFLNIGKPEIIRVLLPMHSIIAPTTRDQAPQTYHKSFSDFITDLGRCRDQRLHIAIDKHHAEVAIYCFNILNSRLHQNMCKLEGNDKFKFNTDIDVQGLFMNKMGPEFRYACVSWATHLSQASLDYQKDLVEMLKEFSFTHILHWLEALSWLGNLDCANSAVIIAQKYVANLDDNNLKMMLSDIGRTVTKYYSVITITAMHIYSSMIQFLPKTTLVYKMYAPNKEQGITVVKGQEQHWGPLLAVTGHHPNWVTSVAYSPDGLRLASGSIDGMVNIWHGLMGSPIATLKGHSNWVSSLLFSPDGSQLASGSYDNAVKLWNTLTYSLIATLEHSDKVTSISLSPDWSRLAISLRDNIAILWNGFTGVTIDILEGHSDSISSIVFSADGLRFATWSRDNSVRLCNGLTGASIATLEGHSDVVTSLVFSPDGSVLASSSNDSTVIIWDGLTGTLISVLEGHFEWVAIVIFSPDGSKLASGSISGIIKLWNRFTGSPIATLEGHSSTIILVKFSPDGSRLASSSQDNTVRLWNVLTGVPISVLEGNYLASLDFEFSPDGSRFACGSGTLVWIWNALPDTPLSTDEDHLGRVTSVVFSPDGSRLASGSEDGTVKLWDVLTGELISVLEGHTLDVTSVVFSPDGTRLASSSFDKTVRTWNGLTGATIGILEGHSDWLESVAFSPDRKMLASGSRDHTIRLWHEPTGKLIAMLEGHLSPVFLVVFSSDGFRLASASWDKTIKLWNGCTGVFIATLKGNSEEIASMTSVSVVFSPDGSRLASSPSGNMVRLWDGLTGVPVAMLEGHSSEVTSLAFSPDGSRLASGSYDNTVRLWDGITGDPIATLEGHLSYVSSIAYSPDGSWLVAASQGNTIKFWHGFTGVPTTALQVICDDNNTPDTYHSISPSPLLGGNHDTLELLIPSTLESSNATSHFNLFGSNIVDTSIFCIPPDLPISTDLSVSKTHIACGTETGHVIILGVPFFNSMSGF